jgi:hypothetical protein
MQVTIDTKAIDAKLELWRYGDQSRPLLRELHNQIPGEQESRLRRQYEVAGSWITLLRMMNPGPNRAEFDALIGKISDFREWARVERESLSA